MAVLRFAVVAAIVAAVAAVAAVARHVTGSRGRHVPGGTLIRDTDSYDRRSRLLMGSFYDQIAADIATEAAPGARLLDVGCGPGGLAVRLASGPGLDVTGLDLDPAMIQRARANAERTPARTGKLEFVVGDVSAMPFADASFDLVVSTMSLHHWADKAAGLAEVARVLKPDGKAIVWDFRAGWVPLHPRMPDPLAAVDRASLAVVDSQPWHWPWRLSFTRRIELARRGEA